MQLFQTVVRRWESVYAMMSVALDEALSLRARSELVCARLQVSVADELFGMLADTLVGGCDALADHGRHVSDLPVVVPLNANFFRGDAAQSAASWNHLLHHVLLGGRSRFFQKIRILSDTVETLTREFHESTDEIVANLSVGPGPCWRMLDPLHYDMNTCLREVEVILKSFLRALPAEQVSAFSRQLDAPPAQRRDRVRTRLSRVSA